MRRIGAVVVLALAGAACSTSPIVLRARFTPGTQRVYELTATATTTVRVGTDLNTERSVLRARSTIVVLSSDEQGARLRLMVEPLSFVRDGVAEERPAQDVELTVGIDGTVLSIESVEGLPIDPASGADELAPLLGIPLPVERLHLAERWSRTIGSPESGFVAQQTGRVSGLRIVDGYRSAIVHVGTSRPIRRQRIVAESQVGVAGTEFTSTTVSFALDEGFPVRIETDAEGRFIVEGAPEGGGVTTKTRSVLALVEAGTPEASVTSSSGS